MKHSEVSHQTSEGGLKPHTSADNKKGLVIKFGALESLETEAIELSSPVMARLNQHRIMYLIKTIDNLRKLRNLLGETVITIRNANYRYVKS